jgi:hypothetical protein
MGMVGGGGGGDGKDVIFSGVACCWRFALLPPCNLRRRVSTAVSVEVAPTSALVCPNDLVQIWLVAALEVAELLLLLVVVVVLLLLVLLLLLLLARRHLDLSAVLEHVRALK